MRNADPRTEQKGGDKKKQKEHKLPTIKRNRARQMDLKKNKKKEKKKAKEYKGTKRLGRRLHHRVGASKETTGTLTIITMGKPKNMRGLQKGERN